MNPSVGEANERSRKAVLRIRNLLIVFGIYWLSLWLAGLLGLSVGITHSHVYGENVFSAFYIGAFMSWERTLAAILAGVGATLIVPGRGSHFWALVIAALYAVDYRTRSHWVVPPTAWDSLSARIEHFLPVIACIVAAFVTAWLRTKRQLATVRLGG